jgi:lipoprotein-anchoring transpeptidase ErfK/SrfK
VPNKVALLYGASVDDGFRVRASRMELVHERFWQQQVDDTTGEPPGPIVVDTTNHFLYHVGDERHRYALWRGDRRGWVRMGGAGPYRMQAGMAQMDAAR